MSLLELNNVSKSFGSSCVLMDVNLSIAKGEFVAIVGFSGAGKTTLISLIAGLLKADTGTVMLGGQPVTGPGVGTLTSVAVPRVYFLGHFIK